MIRLLNKVAPATLWLLASQLILLQAMLLVSRRLGTAGYGLYGLAMTANVLVAPLMQWGMEPLLTVKFARGSADENRTLFGVVLRQRQLFGFAIFGVRIRAVNDVAARQRSAADFPGRA